VEALLEDSLISKISFHTKTKRSLSNSEMKKSFLRKKKKSSKKITTICNRTWEISRRSYQKFWKNSLLMKIQEKSFLAISLRGQSTHIYSKNSKNQE
jgi:hypothetical protein